MDDLAELQALLGAVQKQEVKYRLNERNCKELLIKLIEKQLVELIVTLVGPPPPASSNQILEISAILHLCNQSPSSAPLL